MKDVIRFMTSLFPVRTCTNSYFKTRKRPCIRYEIERCSGPCCRKIERSAYLEHVGQFIDFLKGRNPDILSKMKKTVHKLSENLEFEKAAGLYKRIKAIEGMFEKQAVVLSKDINMDVFGLGSSDEAGAFLFQILHIRNGILISQEKITFYKKDIRSF